MLRHLREPEWLRRNALVTQFLRNAVDASADDYVLLRSMRSLIATLLAELPERPRAIMERTALGGESCRQVARALGISERQLHRDRSFAIANIGRALENIRARKPAESSTFARDVFDVRLAHAWALGEVGSFDASDALLRDMVSGSHDPTRQVGIFGELVRFALERGQIALARTHAECAQRIAERTANGVARLDAAISLSRVLILEGAIEPATRLLRRAVVGLRPLATCGDPAARESLAQALIAQWEVFRIAGHAQEAYLAALEAATCVRDFPRPMLALKMAAGAAVADALTFVWTDPAAAEAEASGYYGTATAAGYLRSALLFATLQAGVAHFKGHRADALRLLASLLPVALDFPNCTTKAYFLTMLGVAFSLNGAASDALASLKRADSVASSEHWRLRGYLSFSIATVQLGAGDAQGAVDSAGQAAELLAARADLSLLGACLNKKAQALATLRRFPEALAAAEESLGLLERSGHPLNLDDARAMIQRIHRVQRTARS